MRERIPLGAAVALLTSLCALAACSRAARPHPNIILVVIDTLRADRLGSYGNERGLTPFLDSLAARAFVFRRAYAQSSWTNPSVASLFTSRFPSQHRVTAKPRNVPAPLADEVMLAEVLQQSGYATGAFVANSGLIESLRVRNGRSPRGFGQGFDVYRRLKGIWVPAKGRSRRYRHTRGAMVNLQALAWLRSLEKQPRKPIFLYLQYMEPHIPYAPSPAALRLVGRDDDAVRRVNARQWLWNKGEVTREDLQQLTDVYDAEVASVDAAIGKLFERLGVLGILDDAIVIVTADHGEELHGHGVIGHGQTLYDSLIHIPLIVSVPGQSERVDLDGVVSQIDVAPTLLDWVGIDRPSRFQGRSLLPRMRRARSCWRRVLAALGIAAGKQRMAFSELVRDQSWPAGTHHQTAVVSDRGKLIAVSDGAEECYDLQSDPAEQRDGEIAPAEKAVLESELAAFRSDVAGKDAAPDAAAASLGEAELERLRALGYE